MKENLLKNKTCRGVENTEVELEIHMKKKRVIIMQLSLHL